VTASVGFGVSEVNGGNNCLTAHSFTARRIAELTADEIILAPVQLSVLRLIPKEEIREERVDGFIPSSSAAPPGP
jgi:hypothetical protein